MEGKRSCRRKRLKRKIEMSGNMEGACVSPTPTGAMQAGQAQWGVRGCSPEKADRAHTLLDTWHRFSHATAPKVLRSGLAQFTVNAAQRHFHCVPCCQCCWSGRSRSCLSARPFCALVAALSPPTWPTQSSLNFAPVARCGDHVLAHGPSRPGGCTRVATDAVHGAACGWRCGCDLGWLCS